MKLPKTIPVFPLSNFIIFPKTTVPLNIFEPRYIDMVNDSMKADKFIGMVQPKITKNFDDNKLPSLHKVGCLGKIDRHEKTSDGRILINLSGLSRFKIDEEINNDKLYREFIVNYDDFKEDTRLKEYTVKNEILEKLIDNFSYKLTASLRWMSNKISVSQNGQLQLQSITFVLGFLIILISYLVYLGAGG